MAIACVLAMIAFVFISPFAGRSERGRNDPVAATTVYGDVHESELYRMHSAKELANNFLERAMAMAGTLQSDQPFFGPPSETRLVNTMLLARKGQQMGMTVTDEEVTQFLQQVTRDRVTSEKFAEILRSLGGGGRNRIGKTQLYDALRTEILALRMGSALSVGVQTTPAQRWEMYAKIRERASAEVVPVAVADFLDKVADPDEATLQKFFEAHKDSEPAPGAPVPGFKIPAKVALQYFKADYDKFYDPKAVTYKEIKDNYEQFKDTLYQSTDDLRSLLPKKADKADDAAADKPEGDAAADAPQPDAAPDADGDAKPPEGATPDAGPGDARPDDKAKPPTEGKSKAPDQSRHRGLPRGPQLSLVALHAADGSDAPAATQDPPVKPDDDAATKAEADADATGDKADDAEASSKDEEAEVLSLSDRYALPTEIQPPKYDPLWKVEGEIRKQLASQAAAKKMDEVLATVREKMARYASERSRWEARYEQDKSAPPPKPLDLAAISEANGLSSDTTKLLSARELAQVDGIGESFLGDYRFEPIAAVAFSQNLALYSAAASRDIAGNRYLFWKIEEQAARVPEFAEIHDDVLRAWKMIEARNAALERAKALAETARKEKLPLAELAKRDDLEAHETGKFSWLTFDSTPGMNSRMPPRQSEVEGVEDAGSEFMQAVFALPVDGIGTAFNNPRTVAYVIQVTDLDPPQDVLRQGFLADSFSTYESAFIQERFDMNRAWVTSLQRDAKLNWARTPDAKQSRESEPEA
ncbi:MAG: hypothetical protein HYX69_06410 [Planctomycetia bacterium]|nr:hypothetical protein [Planctomycetia bacterium]